LRYLEGYTFQGTQGAVLLQTQNIVELYLGNGRTIGNEQIFVTANSNSSTSASVVRTAAGWRCSASSPVKIGLTFPLPAIAKENELTLVCKDTQREAPAENASLRISNSSVIATCVLGACVHQDLILSNRSR
jgi:hypothetical protein